MNDKNYSARAITVAIGERWIGSNGCASFAVCRPERPLNQTKQTVTVSAIRGQTAAILAHRLLSMERVSLAFAALSALEPGAREAVFEAAQWGALA